MDFPIGINGAGRIGRALLRLLQDDPHVRIALLNDVAAPDEIAHLLRHDSVHGLFPGPVSLEGRDLLAGSARVPTSRESTPAAVPWSDHGVRVVVEATGRFARAELAEAHLHEGVERVVVSAVCPGAARTIVLGVNEADPAPDERIVSTASCTTHAAALPLALLDAWYGIESAEMSTVHCTTGSQPPMDTPHRDRRRARSALLSMIPTTTSAARGLPAALPQLEGRLSCLAVRVPTATVSLVTIVAATRRDVDAPERLAERFREAAAGRLSGILGVSDEELVSIDFRGDPRTSIIDLPLLARPGARLVRVIAWYDNEWGYAARLGDLLRHWARAASREER